MVTFFCRVRNQPNSLVSDCRVDGCLEGLILLAVDFGNHNDLCKRLAGFTVHPLVAVGRCNVNRIVLRDSDLVTVVADRNGAVYCCTRAKRERCVIRIALWTCWSSMLPLIVEFSTETETPV